MLLVDFILYWVTASFVKKFSSDLVKQIPDGDYRLELHLTACISKKTGKQTWQVGILFSVSRSLEVHGLGGNSGSVPASGTQAPNDSLFSPDLVNGLDSHI